MATAYAPSSQATAAASSAPTMVRLYLVDNGAQFEFLTTDPADASLTLNADGQYEVDVLSTARLAKSGTGDLIVYGG